MFKYRRQRPVKGGRDPLPACVLHEIREAVEKQAMKFGVSKSFVIAVILAKALGIKDQEPLIVEKKRGPWHDKATKQTAPPVVTKDAPPVSRHVTRH